MINPGVPLCRGTPDLFMHTANNDLAIGLHADRATGHPWRCRLHASLCLKADPLFVFPDRIVPGESIWRGSQIWAEAFTAAGLVRGDRIVIGLEPSPAFLMVLVAALSEGLTVAMVAAERRAERGQLLAELDARLFIGDTGFAGVLPDCDGVPSANICELNEATGQPTPEICMLMRTSGSSGTAKMVALSTLNIMTVIDAHMPSMGLEGAVVLSLLPWHHSFGLIINLLPAIFAGSTVVREATGGREVRSILEMARMYPPTHMSMVPLQAERLSETAEGLALLQSLYGGAVGGAPVGTALASTLSGTRLRAGYGQTEASPGVSLGEPGVWCAGYIGTPLGCRTRIGDSGVLEVYGDNVCMGVWAGKKLVKLEDDRWLNTGDVVRPATIGDAGGLVFIGRVDANIKLANGRLVDVGSIEAAIRRRVGGVSEAWVCSPDGHQLVLGVLLLRGATAPLHRACAACFGVLADRFTGIVTLNHHALPRTGKGAVDRSRLAEAIGHATSIGAGNKQRR